MTAASSIVRVDYGWFVRPAAETAAGVAHAEPVLGYAVVHSRGLLLLDTGMGEHPDVDGHYRPRRTPLGPAMRSAGLDADDVAVVVNCHLHFDHCGGNPALAGRPVVVQAGELAAARRPDYTLPELIDAPGTSYDVVDGDAEVLPGVLVVPTPGHTDGHQSVIVRQPDGTVVVLAGQSHDTASQFGFDALAVRIGGDPRHDGIPIPPEWVRRLLASDPKQVYFAHDHAVWTP